MGSACYYSGYNGSMFRQRWFWGFLVVALAATVGMVRQPVAARAPAVLTPFPTPTPGADGVIRYKVQPGDTLWRVAAIAKVSVDELRALNNLRPDQPLQPGQILILGVGVSEQPTATPQPGAPPTATPTATPEPGVGTLCVLLYDDENGNGLYEEDTERPLAGGAVSVTTRVGSVSLTATTNAKDFVCFDDLKEGKYIVTIGVPKDYNPTTEPNVTLTLRPGDTTYVTFGAQRAAPATTTTPQKHKSPLLGIIGFLFLAGGVVLWVFAARRMRRR